jgi:hypothetical protein
MIAYKWVIKQNKKYYSLISYGIDCWLQTVPIINYKLNNTYSTFIDFDKDRIKTDILIEKLKCKDYCEHTAGFHFWKTPNTNSREFKRYCSFLQCHKNVTINCILKCEVEAIIKENDFRLVAGKFTVLEEITI